MGTDARAMLSKLFAAGVLEKRRTFDKFLQQADTYRMVNGLLYRCVYNVPDDEVQLRPVAPTGNWEVYEDPGKGPKAQSFRSWLLMQYHNSPLVGHRGRDKTNQVLGKDWWWPGMYEYARNY